MLPLYQTARLYVVLADIILLLMLLQLCCFIYLLVSFTPCSTLMMLLHYCVTYRSNARVDGSVLLLSSIHDTRM